MTKATADTHEDRPTIRGDQLLLGLRFLERFCERYTPAWQNENVPAWFSFLATDYQRFGHSYGIGHWMGEIAIRLPARKSIDATFNEMKRDNTHFVIECVVQEAINATTNNLGAHGLDKADIELLTTCLNRFFIGVTSGKFTSRDIALPMSHH